MKKLVRPTRFKIFLTVCAFCLIGHAKGQDSLSQLNTLWNRLVTHDHKRFEVMVVVLTKMSAFNPYDSMTYNIDKKSLLDAIESMDSLDNHYDSSSVALVHVHDTMLGAIVRRAYIFINTNRKTKNRDEIQDMFAQWIGCEDRFNLARRKYNDRCVYFNRNDLVLD